MESPELEKNSYHEIGELLRRARDTLRMPIDQAARTLHIRVRYLDAMEKGQFEELPGLPYVRGYIQTYAQFLGLDKDEILRRVEDIEKSISASKLYLPQVLSKEKTPRNSFVWGGLLASLVVYVLWSVATSHSNKSVSVVDMFSLGTNGKPQNSAQKSQDQACLKDQSEVYPPCIVVDAPNFRVTPWPQKINSIMEISYN